MRILIGLLMAICGTLFYIKGETKTRWLGDSNKNWKYAMGIPIGLIGCFITPWALLCIPTYFIACESGYGDNNWITKLIGKTPAIVLHGTLVGLASLPLTHAFAFLAGILSGTIFYLLEKYKVNEPYCAILRGIGGSMLLI